MLPGDPSPIEVLGTLGRVLRLLALSSGHCFSSEWLAEFLGYRKSSSVAPMIMQLRQKLGGSRWGTYAIQSDHGVGYQLNPATVQVDAFEFRDRTEHMVQLYREAAEPDDIPSDDADRHLAIIEKAVENWRVNPAIGLESLTARGHQYYYEYDHQSGREDRGANSSRTRFPGIWTITAGPKRSATGLSPATRSR